jgi:phage terminase small subunit
LTARRQLGREGLTIVTRFGEVRAHPCVAIARDATTVYSRLLAQLALDAEAEG